MTINKLSQTFEMHLFIKICLKYIKKKKKSIQIELTGNSKKLPIYQENRFWKHSQLENSDTMSNLFVDVPSFFLCWTNRVILREERTKTSLSKSRYVHDGSSTLSARQRRSLLSHCFFDQLYQNGLRRLPILNPTKSFQSLQNTVRHSHK